VHGRLGYLRTIGRGELTIERVVDAAWRRAVDLPSQIAWRLPTESNRQNEARLASLKDRHLGERCFVMANGPSLAKMSLDALKGEITFGMNRIYRLQLQLGFLPTYLVTADLDVQLHQIADELRAVRTTRFVNYNARRLFEASDSLMLVKETFRPRFATDVTRGVWGGHSVTYTCLQLAFYMGFASVVLIGKDHNYEQSGVPGQVVFARGDEENHAIPGYYASGQRWRIPDYKGEEYAYAMARAAYERAGRRVVDATVNGRLMVFEKCEFSELF
jgi:hypothetical protein